MSKHSDLNEKIAKYFGFTKYKDSAIKPTPYSRKKYSQWRYPDDWYMSQGSETNFDIPDFLTMLEDYMKLMKSHGGSGKIEYFGRLD